MTDDDRILHVLRTATTDLPPHPAPVETVVRRAKGLRRRRRATRGTVLGVVVITSVLTVGLDPTSTKTSTSPAATTATPVTTNAPTETAPQRPRVVASGERVDVGQGSTITLTSDGQIITVVWTGTTQLLEHRNRLSSSDAPLSFTSRALGDLNTTLYVGTYRGTGTLDSVTIEQDGRTLRANVVTLNGAPGWAAFHLQVPQDPVDPAAPPTLSVPPKRITVVGYTADGTVLDRYPRSTRR
ncbi:hypothetical protein [Embleya sp. NPDC001921]